MKKDIRTFYFSMHVAREDHQSITPEQYDIFIREVALLLEDRKWKLLNSHTDFLELENVASYH